MSGKRDLPTEVTVPVVSSAAGITEVEGNTVYSCGSYPVTYLTITAVETSNLESQVWFVSGSAAPTVQLPATVPVIGSVTFKASKGYVISFQNGVAVVGEYDVS